MNVDPVQAKSAGVERQIPEQKTQLKPVQLRVVSGTTSKTEISSTQSTPAPPLIPEHEVKVQLDTLADGIEIYQILDKQSGNLVLQVPSAAELRAIHQTQELLQQIADRGKVSTSDAAAAGAQTGEGTDNGSKL
jgi:hypothetical protein